jgi:hypothetical protein
MPSLTTHRLGHSDATTESTPASLSRNPGTSKRSLPGITSMSKELIAQAALWTGHGPRVDPHHMLRINSRQARRTCDLECGAMTEARPAERAERRRCAATGATARLRCVAAGWPSSAARSLWAGAAQRPTPGSAEVPAYGAHSCGPRGRHGGFGDAAVWRAQVFAH